MTKNETEIENWRKRLIFRSDHRGIKEMDIIMGNFAGENVWDFTEDQLQAYDDLLQENDPNLYNWIIGKEEAPEHIAGEMFEKIRTKYE